MKPSIILVREWEQQMSGSGCCGRLEGDLIGREGERVFAERRSIMEAMGPLYMGIRSRFGDTVDLLVIDPRNQVAMLPRLFRDFRRYRVGFKEAFRTLRDLSTLSVVVNGRLFERGRWPSVAAIARYLERAEDGDRRRNAS